MLRKSIVALGWLLVAGTLFAADVPALWQVKFNGQKIEISLAPGETVRLRDKHTGESVFLRALPSSKSTGKAALEISRAQGKETPQFAETVELAAGETIKARHLPSFLELHLLQFSSATATDSASDSERFQLTLMLPGDRKVMAVIEAKPEEMVRIRDRRSGLVLGFRPSLTKDGGPLSLEVLSMDQKAGGGGSFRFVTRVPMGGDFILRGDRLGLAGNGAPLKIRGLVEPANPAMWDNQASVGNSSASARPVPLKARWADGQWIQGFSLNGEIFRVGVPGVEGEIGFAPATACSADDTLSVSVFEIRKIPGAGETLQHIETIEARSDQPTRVMAYNGQLEVQLGSLGASQSKAKCWMTCGQESGHGCSVSCGDVDCCSYPCCFPLN